MCEYDAYLEVPTLFLFFWDEIRFVTEGYGDAIGPFAEFLYNDLQYFYFFFSPFICHNTFRFDRRML